MKEKIKNQKGFSQIPLLIVIISLIISTGVGIVFPNDAKSVSLREFLKYTPNCIPEEAPDLETGCRICGEAGDESVKVAYEECRQVYFLKKQSEILESQQNSKNTLIEESESKNLKLQELLGEQNKQIEELIQGLEQQSQIINALTASLQNTNLLKVSLFIILGIFLVCLILFFIKRKRKKKD